MGVFLCSEFDDSLNETGCSLILKKQLEIIWLFGPVKLWVHKSNFKEDEYVSVYQVVFDSLRHSLFFGKL